MVRQKLKLTFETKKEVFSRTDGDFDPGLAELSDFPGPDTRAVDEVVALDDAHVGQDAGHVVVVGQGRRLKANSQIGFQDVRSVSMAPRKSNEKSSDLFQPTMPRSSKQ